MGTDVVLNTAAGLATERQGTSSLWQAPHSEDHSGGWEGTHLGSEWCHSEVLGQEVW